MKMAKTKFKEACSENGLTAKKIAEKTGIKERTIYSYFDGTRSPSSTTRKILREKLGLETSKLFD